MRADRLSRWFVRCAAVVAVGGVLGLPATLQKATEWASAPANSLGAVTADDWEWSAASTVVPVERLAG
jgi:hypothetical protein